MCARYSLHATNALVADLFDLLEEPVLAPRFNIAPTTMLPSVVMREGTNQLVFFKWGLVPSWAKDPSIGVRMINARSETASEKPSFRAAIKYRRCLIPASGFYEWVETSEGKQPYYIRMRDSDCFAIAGLYELWESPNESIESCTILTTSPNETLEKIHDRMPVIIAKEQYDFWLDPEQQNPQLLTPLFEPFIGEPMEAYPVTRKVGNPRYESDEAIQPIKLNSLLIEDE